MKINKIKTIKMFGKDCRIQCIDKEKNLWDFLDLPIESSIYNDFEEAKKLNEDCDGKRNRLDKEILPKLRAELAKSDLGIDLNSVFIPTKEDYEGKIPFYKERENRIKYWVWGDSDRSPSDYWTLSPDSVYYDRWWVVILDGHLDWGSVCYTCGVSCVFHVSEDESLNENIKPKKALNEELLYIYQFPRSMTEEDIKEAEKYSLEYLGKVNKNGFQPGDYLIKGKLNDLEKYCNEYLGSYEMYPDYLYKEKDIDLEDILDIKEEQKPVNQLENPSLLDTLKFVNKGEIAGGFDIGDDIFDWGAYFSSYFDEKDCEDDYDKTMYLFAKHLKVLNYQPDWYTTCNVAEFIDKNKDTFDMFLNKVYIDEYQPRNFRQEITLDDEEFYDVYMDMFDSLINGNFSEQDYALLLKLFNANKVNEALKEPYNEKLVKKVEEKVLIAATSNFDRLNYLPLLVAYTWDEVEDSMSTTEDSPIKHYDEYESETEYEDALEKWKDNYIKELDVCILSEDDIESLQEKINEFNTETKNIAIELDVNKDGYQEYSDEFDTLKDIKITLEPGYYSGIYLKVNDKDFDYLSDEVKKEQLNRFRNFFNQLKDEYGLTELKIAWGPASNGEVGYIKADFLKEFVDEELENEDLDEDILDIGTLTGKLAEYLNDNKFYYENISHDYDIPKINIWISWGDWKHDHRWCDILVERFLKSVGWGIAHIKEIVTEEDGSDCYSAIHEYVVYRVNENKVVENVSNKSKKSKNKFPKVRYSGNPAKEISMFNHMMGSDTSSTTDVSSSGTSVSENLNEEKESILEISKQDTKKIIDWWKEIISWNNENKNIFNITEDGLENEEEINSWHTAMFDMLSDIKKQLDKEEDEKLKRIYRKGKRLYNKYALSQFNESKHNPAIENKKTMLKRCGYDCDIIDDEGYTQQNIRGNHIALCEKEKAGVAKIVDTAVKDKLEYIEVEDIGKSALEALKKKYKIEINPENKFVKEYILYKDGKKYTIEDYGFKQDVVFAELKLKDSVKDSMSNESVINEGIKEGDYVIYLHKLWFDEAFTDAGEDEPDIVWLQSRYTVDIERDDTDVIIRGEKANLERLYKDFNLRDYGVKIEPIDNNKLKEEYDDGPEYGYASVADYERAEEILDEMHNLRKLESEEDSRLIKMWMDKKISSREYHKQLDKLYNDTQNKLNELYDELCKLVDASPFSFRKHKIENLGEKVKDKEIIEEAFSKPEGDKITSYNNALKYAKKYEVPFIYGYTNGKNKFFALEQPIKCNKEPTDCVKEFKNKYKQCKIVYVAYPDKRFVNNSNGERSK